MMLEKKKICRHNRERCFEEFGYGIIWRQRITYYQFTTLVCRRFLSYDSSPTTRRTHRARARAE